MAKKKKIAQKSTRKSLEAEFNHPDNKAKRKRLFDELVPQLIARGREAQRQAESLTRPLFPPSPITASSAKIKIVSGQSETEVDVPGEFGVSVSDVVALFENDPQVVREKVRQWINNNWIKATKIGKDPNDGRASLYKLSEILSDAEKIHPLSASEKSHYRKQLCAKRRRPKMK